MSPELGETVTLFYCYAREDERLLSELEKHLTPLRRQGYLTGWHNRQIQAGADWQQEIERHLSAANLILLLLSPDFVHSDACDEEMRQAMELHRAGRARVIPLLLRPVLWEGTALADLQGLPENGQPLTTWPNQDQAFRQVAYRLANLVREQLNLSPLPRQDWQALLSPTPLNPFSPPQPEIDDPAFVPRNPYRGLQPFTTENAADFFGRERLIAELLQAFQKVASPSAPSGSARLLSVVGPSGSGKSSVVLAGLLPALKRGGLAGSEHWTYLEPMMPGQHPLEALARTLSSHFPQRSLRSLREDLEEPTARGLSLLLDTLAKGKATTVFFYIDQFEEVFTQTLEGEERAQFINLLLTALTEHRGVLALVISLRADFYDRPMLHIPRFFRLMKAAQVEVLPLDQRDLRDVIKKPAALPDVQLRFEDDLVGELLAEMREQSGALPLLQFTLDRLFQAREGQVLTMAAYHQMGGVQSALAQHAEAIYASLPTESHRMLTRALFLCLVEPRAANENPTRRRVILSELALNDVSQAKMLDEVAAVFTEKRLLTTTAQDGKAVVEVSHEALIRGWARLATWLRHAHEDLSLQRRVREDAAAWIRQGRSTAWLYRDEQLTTALAWRQRCLLSQDEEDFLQESRSEEEQRRLFSERREVAQQRRYRRRMVLISLGGVGLAAVTATGTIGWFLDHQTSPPLTLPYVYHGHTDIVSSVAWSPDGKRLASASDDKTVRVWDAGNGQTLLTYTGHTNFVSSVAWSPDGKRLASASDDKTVRVWDAGNGQSLLICTGHTNFVSSVAWSPDGKRLASASSDRTVRIWDAGSGQLLFTYTGHTEAVSSVAWSPDGRWLASASDDRTVRVWDASSGRMLLTCTGHTNVVESVAWSSDGRWLASASFDRTVRVWDAGSERILLTYTGHTSFVESVAWSPEGRQLASASADQTVRIWDARLSSGRTVLTYTGHTYFVLSVAWSPEGKRLASASFDRTVRVWDAGSGQSLLIYTGHTDIVSSVAWSPDGKRLASASFDQTVRVWDAGSGQTLRTCTGHTNVVESVVWSPEGKRLASASFDRTVRVWDAGSGQSLLTCTGHTNFVSSVAWSPDGKRLASASADRMVRVWDAGSGQTLRTCMGHTQQVRSVAWSPNGRWLASASDDRTVRIWDAGSGQPLLTYTGHTDAVSSVAWSPEGKRLVSASYDTNVLMWLWIHD